jgi:hypothetical protein
VAFIGDEFAKHCLLMTDHNEKIDRILEAMARRSAFQDVMHLPTPSIDELRERYANDPAFAMKIALKAHGLPFVTIGEGHRVH